MRPRMISQTSPTQTLIIVRTPGWPVQHQLTPKSKFELQLQQYLERSKASISQLKKTDYLDELSKDGKLNPQECQHPLNNKLCLVCGKGGHIATAYPKATKDHAAKATSRESSKAPTESSVKASEAKK